MHVAVSVCADSGYLSTPYCFNRENKVMIRRPEGSVLSYGDAVVGDIGYEAPRHYCNLHNINPNAYPIDPNKELNPDYLWDENSDWPWNNDNNGNNGSHGNGNNGNNNRNDDEETGAGRPEDIDDNGYIIDSND